MFDSVTEQPSEKVLTEEERAKGLIYLLEETILEDVPLSEFIRSMIQDYTNYKFESDEEKHDIRKVFGLVYSCVLNCTDKTLAQVIENIQKEDLLKTLIKYCPNTYDKISGI